MGMREMIERVLLLILILIFDSNALSISFTDCGSDYFRKGAEWPLEKVANAGNTVRICQNEKGKDHFFATLYSTTDRIPVYSAVKIARFSDTETNKRPDSTWDYQCEGLCISDENFIIPTNSSFLCNLWDIGRDSWPTCGKHQALNDDYYGNTQELGIDRGHLLPNAIMNQNLNAQKATFTLTNISPQFSGFNQNAWNVFECMVRKYLDRKIPDQFAYLIVGTYGTKMLMNEENPNKNPVRLAQFYWTAFCYVDENSGDSYSWVYVQENDKKSCHSSGDLFMSVQSFTTQFYKGANLFDDLCQSPTQGFGPWFAILNDWENSKNKYDCNYSLSNDCTNP